MRPAVVRELLIVSKRNPSLHLFRKCEPGWHNPGNSSRFSVQCDLLAYDARVSPEMPFPKAIAQQDFSFYSLAELCGAEPTAESA